MYSYILTADGVSLYLAGKMMSAEKSHPNYEQILDAIRSLDFDSIPSLISTAVALEAYAANSGVQVDVDAGTISYNGVPLQGYLIDRIFGMRDAGFEIDFMVKYLSNLMQNPSQRAVDELHKFNEYGKMPITEDGYFIAYKRIKNWYDTHSQTVFNKPAHLMTNDDAAKLPYTTPNGVTVELVDGCTTVSMDRDAVDPNAHNTCSTGLHFCSQSYLKSFSGDKIVILKINPADVVSIPTDYNNTKGRCWRYQVIDVLSDEDFKRALDSNILPELVAKTPAPAPVETLGSIEVDPKIYSEGYADGRYKKVDNRKKYEGQPGVFERYCEGHADGRAHKKKRY